MQWPWVFLHPSLLKQGFSLFSETVTIFVISDVISCRLRGKENESELSIGDETECFNAENVVIGDRLMKI